MRSARATTRASSLVGFSSARLFHTPASDSPQRRDGTDLRNRPVVMARRSWCLLLARAATLYATILKRYITSSPSFYPFSKHLKPLPDHMNADPQLQSFPGTIGSVDRNPEDQAQSQTGSVSQRQADRTSPGRQASGNLGLLGCKWGPFLNRGHDIFPSFIRINTLSHQFGVDFGEIHGADGGLGQAFRRQVLRSGLLDLDLVEHRQPCRSIQHDATHAWRPRAARQSARPPVAFPVSQISGHGVAPARSDASAS